MINWKRIIITVAVIFIGLLVVFGFLLMRGAIIIRDSGNKGYQGEALYFTVNEDYVTEELFSSVPSNQFLARLPWPIYHANPAKQSSTNKVGPQADDNLKVQAIKTDFGPSPWSVLSEEYPGGERVIWGATFSHVFKVMVHEDIFELIDSYHIKPILPLPKIHWNLFVLQGNRVMVNDTVNRRFLFFADSDPADPRSDIQKTGEYFLPNSLPGRVRQPNITYDGYIITLTSKGWLMAVKADFSGNLYFYELSHEEDEFHGHNAFAVDKDGGIYMVTSKRMMRVNWTGSGFEEGWSVPYDTQGPKGRDGALWEVAAAIFGLEGMGSGTTPTLIGFEPDEDRLVALIDGHTPNNLVLFWRDKIPEDWEGLEGYDRRVAAVLPLPYSTSEGRGYSAECSPTAWGYDIVTAQYNGFRNRQPKNPVTGVQKARWNPHTRQLELVWTNNEINMNGVLTYSKGSNLVYSSGRRDGIYHFYALDWDTGELVISLPLGNDRLYMDQGKQSTINDDGSIIFGTSKGIVRILPARESKKPNIIPLSESEIPQSYSHL